MVVVAPEIDKPIDCEGIDRPLHHADHLKALGLFLSTALHHLETDTDIISNDFHQAVNQLVQHQKVFTTSQFAELSLHSSLLLHSLAKTCTPEALAVFHYTLESLICVFKIDAMKEAVVDLQSNFMRIFEQNQHVMELIQQKVSMSFRGSIILTMQTDQEIKALGTAIVTLLREKKLWESLKTSSAMSLEQMAKTGQLLTKNAIADLEKTKVLLLATKDCTVEQLQEIRESIAKIAQLGISIDFMKLWTLLDDALNQSKAIELLNATITRDINVYTDSAKSAAQLLGQTLMTAFASSIALSSAISIELHQAILSMAKFGIPIPSNLYNELQENFLLVIDAIPKEQLHIVGGICTAVMATQWEELQDLATKIRDSISVNISPIQTTISTVLSSDVLKSGWRITAVVLDGIYTKSREEVDQAYFLITNSISVGCLTNFLSNLPSLLRFEIIRDFCQTTGLFFSYLYGNIFRYANLKLLREMYRFFRGFYEISSVNIRGFFNTNKDIFIDVGFVCLITITLGCYCLYLWFVISARHIHNRSEEIRHGHEGTTWAEIAKKQAWRVKFTTYVITACLSVYLPLTKISLELILTAALGLNQKVIDSDNVQDNLTSRSFLTILDERYNLGNVTMLLPYIAVVFILSFSLPLPWILYRLIQDNKPSGSPDNPDLTFDVDGEQIPFDDRVYTRLVNMDPNQLRCPYRSLYSGFERRWAHYKVYQLLFKVGLTIPLLIIPTDQSFGQGVICTILYFGIFGFTSYSTPFFDPLNNVMEVSGKCTALITCVGGTIILLNPNSQISEILGLVVNFLNIANIVLMCGILLFGIKSVRLFIKNWTGSLTFSDTVRNIEDGPSKDIIPQWELEKEVKHRIWHATWKTVLLSLDDEAVLRRLAELEHAVVNSGAKNIKQHWDGEENSYIVAIRLAAQQMLEGVDVYWNDASGTLDRHLDSKTCFGKMYVQPYPFHCIMVYDDCKDESIVRDNKLQEFIMLNFSSKILKKRKLRMKLRALSESGALIKYPFERQERVTVEDGTETYTDSEGRRKTRTRHTSVEFTCYYTSGVLTVESNSKAHAMSAGFIVKMLYRDGRGDAIAPHTGKTHHIENREATMGQDHIGLDNSMDTNEKLGAFLEIAKPSWKPHKSTLLIRFHTYRQSLLNARSNNESVLGHGFWYFIFNNAKLPRLSLTSILQQKEKNPKITNLTTDSKTAPVFDFLYERMAFVESQGPVTQLWYVFWDDIYSRNASMKRLKNYDDDLNPMKPTSICYQLMSQDQLNIWLNERKLRGPSLSWTSVLFAKKSLFHDKLIALLYAELHRLGMKH